MVNKLLIRAYSVGVGDCIHVALPGARTDGEDFHLLIDCGTRGKASMVKAAIADLKTRLPERNGKYRLDLLLVSHEHEDHIKGIDPAWFEDVVIENLWMSAAMDRNHPQAKFKHKLHDDVGRAMRSLVARGTALGPQLSDIASRYSIGNVGAMEALTSRLPAQNGIEPLYVHAGLDQAALRPSTLSGATFKVLGPEEDIDYFYLGKDIGSRLERLAMVAGGDGSTGVEQAEETFPTNISGSDFRKLRSRLMSSLFAFAEEEGEIVNNTSVMLMIEWRGRRLLFVGDAEWNARYVDGKRNFAWNVAWNKHRAELEKAVDFLKIGHHGSTNSTPWNDREDGASTEPSAILDAILPLPEPRRRPKAKALVSTDRTKYDTIPKSALLVELGRRVVNSRRYGEVLAQEAAWGLPLYETHERAWLSKPQPVRTDLETLLTGELFVEVALEPVPD